MRNFPDEVLTISFRDILFIAYVGFQRRGVHGDERVEFVARRVNVEAAEVDLEAGDASQSTDRGANLGGEVGQGADVVAEDGRGVGELGAGELHAVAGVAAQADGRRLSFLQGLAALAGGRFGGSVGGSHRNPLHESGARSLGLFSDPLTSQAPSGSLGTAPGSGGKL